MRVKAFLFINYDPGFRHTQTLKALCPFCGELNIVEKDTGYRHHSCCHLSEVAADGRSKLRALNALDFKIENV